MEKTAPASPPHPRESQSASRAGANVWLQIPTPGRGAGGDSPSVLLTLPGIQLVNGIFKSLLEVSSFHGARRSNLGIWPESYCIFSLDSIHFRESKKKPGVGLACSWTVCSRSSIQRLGEQWPLDGGGGAAGLLCFPRCPLSPCSSRLLRVGPLFRARPGSGHEVWAGWGKGSACEGAR